MRENRIAIFKKVSWNQFLKDCIDCFFQPVYEDSDDVKKKAIEKVVSGWYSNIKLPVRATAGSAGYDFFLPFPVILKPQEIMKFPTGIRCQIDNGWHLSMYPRSGLGFKYGVRFSNTVGIIDSDYYGSENEGHIWAKLINDQPEAKTVCMEEGTAFCQGIFTQFGITRDDNVTAVRNGGLGSTDGKSENPKNE
jgi:dUTP pyrophosphatase